ncbi:hypothetical protein FRC04_008636 [Tulasnella sp. 424]|nr:hypothetical protein FRC04_008636 [Tulasnella sp. 424]KAG8970769.1 hypothetical protein FRC05_011720 [Tulasnella sp. 425]
MAEVEVQPPTNDAPGAPAQSKSEPAADLSSKKRPAQEKAAEPQKKRRSVFAQVFGTLKKAKEEDAIDNTNDAVRKRREIDARIYGKINRDVNLVRKQDEAKRDRQSASRKEEELAIKDEVMKFRQNCFPRLAGFLVTSDDIPPDTDEIKEPEPERIPSPSPDDVPGAFGPKKPLTHPPPLKQPPALYFLPAILTPAQKKFLDAQKTTVREILAEEQKEWGATKKVGLDEVQQLRKHAEEAMAPVKEKQEDNRRKDGEARKRDDEEPANASTAPVAPTADEEMEVETENSAARGMDAEERIEY